MTCKIYLTSIIVAILFPFVSCNRTKTEQVRNAISAAERQINAEPETALDTLLSLDSLTVTRLRGELRAAYALLLAEAEYKCYQPTTDNEEEIINAIRYFRKHGPEEKYARALMMQGEMLYEQGDAEAALTAYKTAAPLFESLGDMEQLGLFPD